MVYGALAGWYIAFVWHFSSIFNAVFLGFSLSLFLCWRGVDFGLEPRITYFRLSQRCFLHVV